MSNQFLQQIIFIVNKNKKTILFILLAFLFSFSMRLIWVYQFGDTEQFQFNNQFMINTNDGYFWAEGARDILQNSTNINKNSPINTAASILTAYIAKILPFSLESIIFYMPAFFASLLVIPIILIAKSINELEAGFIAALLASIAWSYYNRTMVGYYDTDFLNIVFPTILLWSLIWAIKTHQNKYILFTALDIIAYRWWYPQSYSLEFAFFALLIIYVLYQYIKKENYYFTFVLLTFMILAMMGLDGYIRFTLVIILFLILTLKKESFKKYIYYIFAFSLVLFMVTGGFNPILGQLKGYVFKEAISIVGQDLQLHYYTVMQTIREAGQIPFETFANRISGHTITFVFSLLGYILLVVRYPIILLSLPMIGLGFLSLEGGLRFTIYAVPILALSIGYFIIYLSRKISHKGIQNTFIFLMTMLILTPNIIHIVGYKVPTVFTKNEVLVLDKLKNIASRDDYVVGWWDYGYPIRYYADVKTLSDGGKHSGTVNFSTSFILTNPQVQASKMLRLDVEYTEMQNNDKDRNRTNIANMTLDYGYKDTNNFLNALRFEINLPQKTRDIYLYLPNRMIDIYPTIELFSNIDLMSGKKGIRSFFYKTNNFDESKEFIDLENGVKIDKRNALLIINKQKVPINRFTKTFYDKKSNLQVDEKVMDQDGQLNVIYMSNYKQFLVIENKIYNSLYFQLFILENYDKELFETVILTPLVKVYKLKI